MKHWYAVQCKPGQDQRAELHLLNQAYSIYRPLLKKEEWRAGRWLTITESLFPRYLFIHLDNVTDDWRPIRSTYGVANLVRFGDMPAVVPDSLIAEIKARETPQGWHFLSKYQFKQGDKVRFRDGGVFYTDAIFEQYTGEERVIVLMNLLGQVTRVTVKASELILASA